MHDSQQQERVLHISSEGSGTVTVSLEAAEPVTVRLKIDAKCACQDEGGAVNRPGSYIYTDPAGRKD